MTTSRGERSVSAIADERQLLVDLGRRIACLIQVGTIEQINFKTQRARIRIAGMLTNWLIWSPGISSSTENTWTPLAIGDQVMVFSPSGDTANGFIVSGILSERVPVPDEPPDWLEVVHQVHYKGGSTFQHNHNTNETIWDIPGNGKFTIRVGISSIVIENGEIIVTTPKHTGVRP